MIEQTQDEKRGTDGGTGLMTERHIVLIGFMGTGKSTVGQQLAAAMGRTFADSDSEVEKREGVPVRELFAEKGEPYFRKAETRALTELLSGGSRIVATGGGAVLAEENRNLMLRKGFVVCLEASAETIISRVSGDSNRPLLQGNVEGRVKALLKERASAYDFAHFRLQTDGLSVQEAVDAIRSEYERTRSARSSL